MSKTKRLMCTCEHEFQYGKGKRVFNQVFKNEGTWRCTVCKVERRSGERSK
jgi:hypothetical protein